MEKNCSGYVINIFLIGVLIMLVCFSVYVVFKLALDVFLCCVVFEFFDCNVYFIIINMFLVCMSMIVLMKFYDNVLIISLEEVVDMVSEVLIYCSKCIVIKLGVFG